MRISRIDITVKLTSIDPSHHDLLNDAQLFAQLALDGAILMQTETVGKEPGQPLWKMRGVLEL